MPGTWKPLTNQPPALPGGGNFNAESMILLTDGSVLVHHAYGAEWMRLEPDAGGSYDTGTWSPAGTMTNARQYFASGVLRDARVFAIGGEDSSAGSDTPLGEIYDPLTDTWSALAKPTAFDWIQGDASSCVLPSGKVILGSLNDARTALWDPHANSWREAGTAFGTQPGTKVGRTNEETWTLLHDGTVLTVDTFDAPNAERYLPHEDIWISAGSTPQSLIDAAMDEIGPAILLPDHRVFAIGGAAHTAVYSPGHNGQPGTWSNGPVMQDGSGNPLGANDAPAVLLPSGRVLCCGGLRHSEPSGYWTGPTLFFEYDGGANAVAQTATQPAISGGDTWTARLMLLPTGEVLYTAQGPEVWVYTPDGAPRHEWSPRVTECHHHLHRGESYEIEGHRLTGMSQAVSYGDDYTAATNYPLVRLRSGPTVTYCRTYHFSTFAVATGERRIEARFEVPASAPAGRAELYAVANGIESEPVHVHVH
jgi:hypothetical protein